MHPNIQKRHCLIVTVLPLHDKAILYIIRVTRENSMTKCGGFSSSSLLSLPCSIYHLFRSLKYFKKELLLAKSLKQIISVFASKPKYFCTRAIKISQIDGIMSLIMRGIFSWLNISIKTKEVFVYFPSFIPNKNLST